MVRGTQRGSPGGRDGFTLVELLVVITIIGMLMAMVFPAIGSVIDAVRKLQCSQKLAGLGTALSLYRNQSSQKWPSVSTEPVTGPPGAVGTKVVSKKKKGKSSSKRSADKGSIGTGYSWLVQLLPYMQEENLFKSINRKSTNQKQFSPFDPILVDAEAGDRHLSTFTMGAFQCNAFNSAEPGSNAPEYKHIASGGQGPALSNYVAVSATHLATIIGGSDSDGDDTVPPNGVITYRPKGGLNRVRDGDRTIVAAETREESYAAWMDGTTSWVVGHDPNSQEPSQDGGRWKCEGGCKTSLNVGEAGDDGAIANYRQQWPGERPWRWGPSSMHPGGSVNHLLAGGNVVPIESIGTAAISGSLYLQLITADGGETVELPQ